MVKLSGNKQYFPEMNKACRAAHRSMFQDMPSRYLAHLKCALIQYKKKKAVMVMPQVSACLKMPVEHKRLHVG